MAPVPAGALGMGRSPLPICSEHAFPMQRPSGAIRVEQLHACGDPVDYMLAFWTEIPEMS